jgi:hypothetical protein
VPGYRRLPPLSRWPCFFLKTTRLVRLIGFPLRGLKATLTLTGNLPRFASRRLPSLLRRALTVTRPAPRTRLRVVRRSACERFLQLFRFAPLLAFLHALPAPPRLPFPPLRDADAAAPPPASLVPQLGWCGGDGARRIGAARSKVE